MSDALYRDPTAPVDARVRDLLSRMTLREKVGQLNQRMYGWDAYRRTPDGGFELTEALHAETDRFEGLGALYGLLRADAWSGVRPRRRTRRRRTAPPSPTWSSGTSSGRSRLGIPALFVEEVPHGLMALDGTVLPVNLAVGATWDPDLYERAAAHAAAELRARGGHVALVSALDIARDPRWGRTEECFGEDPYLAARLTEALVRGMQGDPDETGRLRRRQGPRRPQALRRPGCHRRRPQLRRVGTRPARTPRDPPPRRPGRCPRGRRRRHGRVQRGRRRCPAPATAPCSPGCCASDWGFDGPRHGGRPGRRPAGAHHRRQGLRGRARPRLRCRPEPLGRGLHASGGGGRARSGRRRPFSTPPSPASCASSSASGLFEHPYTTPAVCPPTDGGRSARSSPARPSPSCTTTGRAAHRPGTSPGSPSSARTPPPPPTSWATTPPRSAPAPAAASSTPCAASPRPASRSATPPAAPSPATTSPASPRRSPRPPPPTWPSWCWAAAAPVPPRHEFDANGAARQRRVRDDLRRGRRPGRTAAGQRPSTRCWTPSSRPARPTVGRPDPGPPARVRARHRAAALLTAWYPGPWGGEAIAEVLLGLTEPTGRLPVSVPRSAAQLPVYYNHKDTEYGGYVDESAEPRYSFGHGLSYTTFRVRHAPPHGTHGRGRRHQHRSSGPGVRSSRCTSAG